MDPDSFSFFDELRRQHFPAVLNHVPAHLSLFHRLPGEEVAAVGEMIVEICGSTGAIAIRVTGLRHLGRGAAFTLHSPILDDLRSGLAQRFRDWLTPQDRQPFDAHVTIQNKVDPAASKDLVRQLRANFGPFDIVGIGIIVVALLERTLGSCRKARFQGTGVLALN